MNIASRFIDQPAALQPAHSAILADSGCVTYRDLQRFVNRSGRLLLKAGCCPGDRVLIAVQDLASFIAALFGAIKVGAIAVPVNPRSRPQEYQNYISGTAPCVALIDAELAPQLAGAAAETTCVFLESLLAGAGQNDDDGQDLEPVPAAPHDPALILHTSGSTNRQKAVVHSHGSVMATSHNVGEMSFKINSLDRILCLPGLHHAFGLAFGMSFPLAACAGIIASSKRLDPEEVARLSKEHKPTILVAVPSALGALLKASRTWLSLDLSSVRMVISAGESLPPDVFSGFKEQFGLEVLDGIGATEFFHFISNTPGRARAGSCGTPVPGCQVRLLNDLGQEVPDGEIGSLSVKIESAFLKYWGAERLAPEWISTGDKLYRDGQGYFYYCGRDDDMLKVGGMWASPRDMENMLCAYVGIEKCFVTTREDRLGIRRLVAYIVMVPDASVTDTCLLDYLAAILPEHMLPSAIIRLPELPLTLNGKINRAALPSPIWSKQDKSGADTFLGVDPAKQAARSLP